MKRLAQWVAVRAGVTLTAIGVFTVTFLAIMFSGFEAGVSNEWEMKLPEEEENRWQELEKKRRELAKEGKVLPVQEYEEWLALDQRKFPSGNVDGPLGSTPRPRQEGNKESRQDLIDELRKNGVKFDENKIVRIGRNDDGKIVFLEEGNSKAGLEHIRRHADEFESKGIDRDEIAVVVMEAVTTGKQVGTQGTRPVYEMMYKGKKIYI